MQFHNEKILDSIGSFEDTVHDRRELIYYLRKNIDGTILDLPEYPITSAPFRFTVIAPENATGEMIEECSNTLRSAGLDVANLYIPLNWLAPEKVETTGCPYAEFVAPRIINIRIDDTSSRADANTAGQLLNEFAKSIPED